MQEDIRRRRAENADGRKHGKVSWRTGRIYQFRK